MKTTEYIKREAVLSAVGELFTICSHSLPNELGHHYVVEKDIEIFYNYVKDIPTADVKPVVRGEWIGTFDGYADGNPVYDEWQCSVCGCVVEDDEPRWNFCPNCGADMRRNISNFTLEEQKTYWEAIKKKSTNTDINIHDLI